MKTAVEFLIMQIELKADSIPCNTQLNRSVKGAYVDCLVMLKQTKEMFEKQIEDAWKDGFFEKSDSSKIYYHKTFKIE